MLDLIDPKDRIPARNVALDAAEFKDVSVADSSLVNVNLTGARVVDVKMIGVTILDGMTIDGITVKDLFAACRAQNG